MPAKAGVWVGGSLAPLARRFRRLLMETRLRSTSTANAHNVQHCSGGLPDEPINVFGALDLSLDDQ